MIRILSLVPRMHKIGWLMAVVMLFHGCGDGGSPTSESQDGASLLFVHSITLGLERDVMDAVIEEFNASHEGITVRQERMQDDVYQDLGLIKYLESGNPPDLYFEWGGWRLQRCVAQDWALDLTPYMNDGWRDRFYDTCWSYADVNGRTYLSPNSLDASTLLYYNTDLFQANGFQEPTEWSQFVDLCKRAKEAGIIPITAGNDELWVMGNWAAHITSRIAGEQHYADVLSLAKGTTLTDPGFVRALELLAELGKYGCYNADINSISSEQGQVPFRQKKALIHPIGIWVIDDWAKDAPDLHYDYFNTPPIPEGKGDQQSVLGLVSGYVVHKRSKYPDQAVEFLKYLSSADVQRRFVEVGLSTATAEAYENARIDPHLKKVKQLLAETNTFVTPADTGFRLEVAEEFYKAVAQVVGGHSTPLEALARAEQGVARFR